MSDEEKRLLDDEESYEDIFKNLREKYHLDDENYTEDTGPIIYNDPEEEREIDILISEGQQYANDKAAEFMDFDEDDEDVVVNSHSPSDYEWDEGTVLVFESKDNQNESDIPMTYEDISSNNPQENTEEIGISLEKIKSEQVIKTEENDEEASDEKNPEQQEEETPQEENVEFDFVEENDDTEEAPQDETYQISPEYFKGEISEDRPMKDVTYENIVWEDFPDGKEKKRKDKKKKNKKKKHGIFPRKGDSAGEVIRKLVLILSVITILLSAAWLINDIVIQPYLANRLNTELGNTLVDTQTNTVVKDYEKLNEEDRKLTMAKLLERNREYMGWLTMNGADVSLPVVKTTDNDKYLHRDFDGNYLYAGTLFVDYRNTSLYDKNVIIYGHNMNNGSMFGQLYKYKTSDAWVYQSEPLIHFHTINGDFVYKIFAAYLADGTGVSDNSFISNALVTNYTGDAFIRYMDQVAEKRYCNTGVDYNENDSILTLITCDRSEMEDGRLIVVARKVRSGESY